MTEMRINKEDIAEYGARLLEYSVGGTELTRVTGTTYSSQFPKLFHTDYGLRKITVTIVFKAKYPESNGIIAKLHSLALQKTAFDKLLTTEVADIWLPDDFYYNCVLTNIGNENFDGERMEVTYTFNGIRHLQIAKINGNNIHCTSSIKTDCRLTLKLNSSWQPNTSLNLYINRNTPNFNLITIKKLNADDIVVIDGINCTVTKNGNNNIFSDTNIISFPYLIPGENRYTGVSDYEVTTEYYPTFV